MGHSRRFDPLLVTSGLAPGTDIKRPARQVRFVPDSDMHHCIGANHGKPVHCDLRTVFPKVISGLRRRIAIQAAISLNMNLPE